MKINKSLTPSAARNGPDRQRCRQVGSGIGHRHARIPTQAPLTGLIGGEVTGMGALIQTILQPKVAIGRTYHAHWLDRVARQETAHGIIPLQLGAGLGKQVQAGRPASGITKQITFNAPAHASNNAVSSLVQFAYPYRRDSVAPFDRDNGPLRQHFDALFIQA